jgi:hypothetical protein
MCVFSKTAEALVLDRLIEAALTVSPGKCKFTASETTFLGYTVSREGVKANPEAVSAIRNFPTPKNV